MINVTTGFNNLGRQEDDIKISFTGSESDGAGTILIDGVSTKCTFRNKQKNNESFIFVRVITDFYEFLPYGATFIVDNKGNASGIYNDKIFISYEGRYAELKSNPVRTKFNVQSGYPK